MKNEFVTDQSDEAGALDDLERAIRADGQRDVDVEVGSLPACLRYTYLPLSLKLIILLGSQRSHNSCFQGQEK